MQKTFQTVNETSAILNVRPARVRELIRLGKLLAVHHKTSYRWMIKKNDVQKYLNAVRLRGRPLKALENAK